MPCFLIVKGPLSFNEHLEILNNRTCVGVKLTNFKEIREFAAEQLSSPENCPQRRVLCSEQERAPAGTERNTATKIESFRVNLASVKDAPSAGAYTI